MRRHAPRPTTRRNRHASDGVRVARHVLAILTATLLGTGVASAESPTERGGPGIIGVEVIIENLAPDQGTWLTPVWIGFHDGSFDTFDGATAADLALERLAEDGNADPLEQRLAAAPGGVNQGVLAGNEGNPQLAPGESATRTFVVNPTDLRNQYLSYATMVIPSNDAFMGNDDPTRHRILTADGSFLGAFITVDGDDVLDAGTEINDEIPEHTAFFGQSEPDTGEDEKGVIHSHPGYLPPGSGGILDDPMFQAADFTDPGYRVARITVIRNDTVVPAGTVSGVWSRDGSPYLVEGDVVVPSGATLTIEPGTIVYARAGHGIRVEGTLLAEGTEELPILFTGDEIANGGEGWQGLRFVGTTTTSVLEHCIVENGDRASTFESGGGVGCIDASLELHSSTFRDNEAWFDGAGLYASGATVVVDGCLFEGNVIDGTNSARGGAIHAESSTVTIVDSEFRSNRVVPFDSFGTNNARGGALSLVQTGGSVEQCLFVGNHLSHGASGNGESTGGAIYVDGSGLVIAGNTITRNRMFGNHQQGGGIYVEGSATISTNAIADNEDVGIYFGTTGSVVEFNDVFGNQIGDFDGAVPTGLGVITQENVNGDPADAGFNIFLDPLFVDPAGFDFHLQAGSPCIDAGDPDRPQDPDGTIADIGAFYRDQDVVGVEPADVADVPMLLGSWPEPLRSSTVIRYRLSKATAVELSVHDVTGRLVRTLTDAPRDAGEHRVRFDGRDDRGRALGSGAYFYRLRAGAEVARGRLTVIR